jgi:hypothetical protein
VQLEVKNRVRKLAALGFDYLIALRHCLNPQERNAPLGQTIRLVSAMSIQSVSENYGCFTMPIRRRRLSTRGGTEPTTNAMTCTFESLACSVLGPG